MSEIDITAEHDMPHDKALAAADSLATDLAERFDIAYHWDGDHIVFDRVGVNGTIEIGAELLRIRARLGLLLVMLKPTIEAEIRRYLSERLGCRIVEQ